MRKIYICQLSFMKNTGSYALCEERTMSILLELDVNYGVIKQHTQPAQYNDINYSYVTCNICITRSVGNSTRSFSRPPVL